jgi:hypothetical protein
MELENEIEEELKRLREVFPVRSAALNLAIQESETAHKIPTWRAMQLVRFSGVIEHFAEDLQPAYDKQRVMTVSWIARSLLEIFVWVRWCNASEVNAEQFDKDQARDFYGYCEALHGLNIGAKPELKQSTDKLLKGYSNHVRSQGLPDVKNDFKRVHRAAEELGEGTLFLSLNRILSKLAHPTALAMDVSLREVGMKDFRDIFFMDAVEYAIDSIQALEDFNIFGYMKGPSYRGKRVHP